LVPTIPGLRFTIVDVRCKDKSGRQFIVEMQMLWTDSFQSRVLLNASKAYETIGKRQTFHLLQPVYALSLVNQNYVLDSDRYFHHYQIVAVNEPDLQIKGLEFIFIELQKVKALSLKEKAPGRLWLLFLSESEQLIEQFSIDWKKYREIWEAMELLKETSYTKEELESHGRYWDSVSAQKSFIADSLRKGFQQGLEEGKVKGRVVGTVVGREEGREKGIEETQEKTVLRAFQKGMCIEEISGITELSVEEVKTILLKNSLL